MEEAIGAGVGAICFLGLLSYLLRLGMAMMWRELRELDWIKV